MLGRRATEILRLLKDAEDREDWEESEIVCEGAQCWLGSTRVSRATVNQLLRLVGVPYVPDVLKQGALAQFDRRAEPDEADDGAQVNHQLQQANHAI